MIIHFSSTLKIFSLISRHGDPKTIDIPRFILADDHIPDIVVSADTEPGWSQSGFPAQPLGVGGEVVELDGPWELCECVGPGDEFLWGEYDHGVSFLTNSAMSCLSLGSRVVDIRML